MKILKKLHWEGKLWWNAIKNQVTQSMLSQVLNPGAGSGTLAGLPEEYTKSIWGWVSNSYN